MADHREHLDALRGDLVHTHLSQAMRFRTSWRHWGEAPGYNRDAKLRDHACVRDIVAQVRALDAVRAAANEGYDDDNPWRPW